MTVYLPPWLLALPIVWVGMGVLLYPVLMVRLHRSMRHNAGWTWRTTLFGRRFNLARFILGTVAVVVAWPWAMREV